MNPSASCSVISEGLCDRNVTEEKNKHIRQNITNILLTLFKKSCIIKMLKDINEISSFSECAYGKEL